MSTTLPPDRLAARRGHNSKLSISDHNHHVTEAIGGMYDTDEEDGSLAASRSTSRPLSYVVSSSEAYDTIAPPSLETKIRRVPLASTRGNDRLPSPTSAQSNHDLPSSHDKVLTDIENASAPISPNESTLRPFPLTDIDYESSPAAVALELSNLQAIRRMSMSIDTTDPDLPSFAGPFTNPPSPNADETDASRLMWVPARLHPELAPTEFKTFIEDRVDKMRRMSEEGNENFVFQGLERSGSAGIKRKKSMLSRQIDPVRVSDEHLNALERKTSEARARTDGESDLTKLAHLVNDPTSLMRTLSIESIRRSQDSGISVPESEDSPRSGSMSLGLKRSTRTNYRRGSLRKGELVPHSRKAARGKDRDSHSGPDSPPLDEPLPILQRAQTEPAQSPQQSPSPTESNFSRPGRNRRGLGISTSSEDKDNSHLHPSPSPRSDHQLSPSSSIDQQQSPTRSTDQPSSGSTSPQEPFRSRLTTPGRATARLPGDQAPVPHIIETPPSVERPTSSTHIFPQRGSSRQPPPPVFPSQRAQRPPPLINGARSRPSVDSQRDHDTTLNDLSANPRNLPGSGNMRTDDLTLVPTFEKKRAEKKEAPRKTSWGWFLGGEKDDKREEKEKEKEKRRLKEAKARIDAKDKDKERVKQKDKEKEQNRKPKVSSNLAPVDAARLDVLQDSTEHEVRGRESIVLDRESIKLDVERKKQGNRKHGEPSHKKEKDTSILSAIFGGAKRSKDDSSKQRSTSRGLSPEPPPRLLRPDIDYNWTRFSILEERAIYRLAHIKLANPKRALQSQVLLSNFMYSYLAKVQMMHPQPQVQTKHAQHPVTPPQKSPTRQDDKPDEYLQYQRWQEQQQAQDARDTSNGQHKQGSGQASGSNGNSSQRTMTTDAYQHQQQQQQQRQQQHQQAKTEQQHYQQPQQRSQQRPTLQRESSQHDHYVNSMQNRDGRFDQFADHNRQTAHVGNNLWISDDNMFAGL